MYHLRMTLWEAFAFGWPATLPSESFHSLQHVAWLHSQPKWMISTPTSIWLQHFRSVMDKNKVFYETLTSVPPTTTLRGPAKVHDLAPAKTAWRFPSSLLASARCPPCVTAFRDRARQLSVTPAASNVPGHLGRGQESPLPVNTAPLGLPLPPSCLGQAALIAGRCCGHSNGRQRIFVQTNWPSLDDPVVNKVNSRLIS